MKSLYQLSCLILLSSSILVIAHQCGSHKKLYHDYKIPVEPTTSRRVLQSTSQSDYKPIRITFDKYDLDFLPKNAQYLKPWIEKQLITATNYFQSQINVIPEPNRLKNKYQRCLDYFVPFTDKIFGVQDSDLHVYVTWAKEPEDYLVWAGACVLGGESGRVIFGMIKFNINALMKLDFDSPEHYENWLEVTIHSITHLLGFQPNLFKYWKNPATNKYYLDDVNLIFDPIAQVRGRTTPLLKSPNVLQVARDYYDCPTMLGMQLENEGEEDGGSYAFHWEKSILENEYMTGTSINHDASFSLFTLAALKDTNWYHITNMSRVDPIFWGKGKGCDFVENVCNSATKFPEFSEDSQEGCGFYHSGISHQKNYKFYDQCKIHSLQETGYCSQKQNQNLYEPQQLMKFGENSRCFEAKIFTANNINALNQRCFEYYCNSQLNELQIFVDFQEYRESMTFIAGIDDGKVIQIQKIAKINNIDHTFTGELKVPQDLNQFCQFPKPCPNFCSGNGYCLNGICYCDKGFRGKSCSIECQGKLLKARDGKTKCALTNSDSCPPQFYQDPETQEVCNECYHSCNSCVGDNLNQCLTCQSNMHKVTQPGSTNVKCCHVSCSDCDEKNCLSCSPNFYRFNEAQNSATGVNTVFKCVENCPDNFFKQASTMTCDQCTSNCKLCASSASDCTQCIENYYLVENQCLSTCPSEFYMNYQMFQQKQECLPCPSNCLSCLNKYVCLECSNNHYLQQSLNIFQIRGITSIERQKLCVNQCLDNFVVDTATKECVACQSPCKTCVNSKTSCKTCTDNYFQFKESATTEIVGCIEACPLGYYGDQNVCYRCSDKCSTCNSFQQCTSCVDPYTLQGNFCLSNVVCKFSEYNKLENGVQTCEPCHTSCFTCTNGLSTGCTKCWYPQALLEGRCQKECPRHYLEFIKETSQNLLFLGYDFEQIVCKKCPARCQECLSPEICIKCFDKFLFQNQCTDCVDGFFADTTSRTCTPCNKACRECSGKNADQCKSCNFNYFYSEKQQACVFQNQCEEGTFSDYVHQKCSPCIKPCLTCFSTITGKSMIEEQLNIDPNILKNKEALSTALLQLITCFECHSDYVKDHTLQCLDRCSDGYYPNINKICLKCQSQCTHCTSAKVCTACKDNFVLVNGVCQLTCLTKMFKQSNLCLDCSDNCFSCIEKADKCTKCELGYFYIQNEFKCVTFDQIDDGFYGDTTTGLVTPCHQRCSKCTGGSLQQCQECKELYTWKQEGQECSDQCEDGSYREQFSYQKEVGGVATQIIIYICKPCLQGCNLCSAINVCSSCVQGFFLTDSVCLPRCFNLQTFPNTQTNKCQNCDLKCDKCFGPSAKNCITCAASYLYHDERQECIAASECIDQYFQPTDTLKCLRCDLSCYTCSGTAKHCETCAVNYLKNGDLCESSCSVGQYYKRQLQKCVPCMTNCQQCNDLNSCEICATSFFKYNGICLTQCPAGSFQSKNAECLKCEVTCKTCTQQADKCTSCYQNLRLNVDKCQNSCDNGYYLPKNLLQFTYSWSPTLNIPPIVCEPCPKPCLVCDLINPDYCLFCPTGQWLQNKTITTIFTMTGSQQTLLQTCVNSCETLQGFYPKLNAHGQNTCQKCSQNCLTCGSDEACTLCNQGFYLSNNKCQQSCEINQYKSLDPTNNICETCPSACPNGCSSAIQCLGCYEGIQRKYMLGNLCVDDCKDGTLKDASTYQCINCQFGCKTCTSATSCQQCFDDFILVSDQCMMACPIKYFPIYTQNKLTECYPCLPYCDVCFEQSICERCQEGFFFMIENNIPICKEGCPYQFYQKIETIQINNNGVLATLTQKNCYKCYLGCASCTGSQENQCTKCLPFLNLIQNQCLYRCPIGFYKIFNSNIIQCEICPENCEYCYSSYECQLCATGYMLQFVPDDTNVLGSFNCIESANLVCPSGLFKIEISKYLLDNNGFDQHRISQECHQCDLTLCKQCQDRPNKCTQCNSNLVLSDNQCKQSCSNTAFYPNFDQGVCSQCVSPCVTCQSLNYCLSCSTDKFLESGACVLVCSAEFIGIQIYTSSTEYYNICEKCSKYLQNCATCSSQTQCLTCADVKYTIKNNKCVEDDWYTHCGSDTYPDMTIEKCFACPIGCSTCLNDRNCLTCKQNLALTSITQSDSTVHNLCRCQDQNKFFQNGFCFSECLAGFYPMSSQKVCQKCTDNCIKCTNQYTCQQCQNPKYLIKTSTGATCQDECLNTKSYKDNSSRECLPCHFSCQTCQDGGAKGCIECENNYYYDETTNKCGTTCLDGFYKNEKKCKPCVNCARCESLTSCTACSTGKFLQNGMCKVTCEGRFYGDTKQNQCLQCDEICQTCKFSSNNCESCIPGFNLINGQCQRKCYSNQVKINNDCFDCDITNLFCLTCTETAAKCASCVPGRYLQGFSCILKCDDKYYGEIFQNSVTATSPNTVSYGVCNSCHTSCATCTGAGEYVCLTCVSYLTMSTSANQKKCVNLCPAKQFRKFYEDLKNVCEYCNTACKTCSGPGSNNCISCEETYFKLDGNCVQDCGNGKFGNQIQVCQQCNSPCQDCTGPEPNQCEACIPGFFFIASENLCVYSCPTKYYVEGLICQRCPDQVCNQCYLDSNISPPGIKCKQCESGFLKNGQCVSSCSETGEFPNINDQICQQCDSKCQKCEKSATDCTQCKLTYVLQERVCKDKCSGNFYAVNGFCTACDASCLTCSQTATSCSSCSKVNNKYLYNNQCVSSCEVQFYADSQTQTCKQCQQPCKECTLRPTNCASCITGFVKSGLDCITSCNIGTYLVNGECETCHQACYTCSGPNNNNCLSCFQGSEYNLFQGQCIVICPNKYYKKTNQCLQCSAECATCVDNDKKCLICESLFFLSGTVCVSSCGIQKFADSNRVCQQCHQTCLTCSGSLQSDCKTCVSGLFWNSMSQSCIQNCQFELIGLSGYYGNQQTGKCEKCDVNCDKCFKFTECEKCKQGLFLNDTKRCTTTCGQYQYGDYSSNTCKLCQTPCLKCTGSSEIQCTSCLNGFYLQEQTICKDLCLKEGYFPDNGSNTCQPCTSGCQSCTSQSVCTNCLDPFFLYQSTCLTTCPVQKFYPDDILNQCSNCDGTCLTCTGPSATNCDSCAQPLYLDKAMKSCGQTCPYKTFKGQYQTCLICLPSCKSCISLDQCTECEEGSFLKDGTCLSNCPFNSYGDKIQKLCIACDNKCNGCTGPTNLKCIDCSTNYNLQSQGSTICDIGCSLDFYPKNNVCIICINNCATCTTETECLSCKYGYFLQNSRCLTTCTNGFYGEISQNVCFACMEACSTCTGPLNSNCLSCSENLYLLGNKCDSFCLPGYIPFTGNICKACQSTCATCANTIDNCLTCKNNFYLQLNQCISECSPNFYQDPLTANCQACDTTCYTCSSGQSDQCITCSDPLYLLNGYCVPATQCKSNQFPLQQTNNNVCKECTNCATCTDINTCTSCQTGKYLQNNKCETFCLDGYFGDSTSLTCQQCSYQCQTCSSATNLQCKTCKPNYFQLQQQCWAVCPSSYIGNTETMKCQLCSQEIEFCSTCTQRATCGQCYEGFTINSNNLCWCQAGTYLQNGKCLAFCEASNYYEDIITRTCKQCLAQCTDCIDSQQCISCATNFYLQGSSCVTDAECQLISNYFPNSIDNTCALCPAQCSACTSTKSCQQCKAYNSKNYFLQGDQCVISCSNESYGDLTDLKCKLCSNNCLTCSDQTICTSCHSGEYLHTSSCIFPCPITTFTDEISKKCVDCQGCLTCATSVNSCTSCKSPQVLQGSVCQATCNSGYYQNSNRLCQQCNQYCSICTGLELNECTSCVTGSNYYYDEVQKACTTQCTSKYYKNIATQICSTCPDICTTCTSATACQSCTDGYYLNTNTCSQCDTKCKTCGSTGNTQCYSCNINYLKQPDSLSCLSTCPEVGYYPDYNQKICIACFNTCSQCTSQTICTQCKDGSILYGTECVANMLNCEAGLYQFYDSASKQYSCVNCPVQCKTCGWYVTAAQCTECNNGYYKDLVDDKCKILPTQVLGYYFCYDITINQLKTLQCLSSCDECYSERFYSQDCSFPYCTKCQVGYSILNGECVLNSPPTCQSTQFVAQISIGQYQCVDCGVGCSSCSHDATGGIYDNKCIQCNTGYILANNVCFQVCLQSQYQENQPDGTFICKGCDLACKSCTSQGPQNCIECDSGYKKVTNDICEQFDDAGFLQCNDYTMDIGNNVCVCIDQSQFYDIVSKKCYSEINWPTNTGCQFQQYYDIMRQECRACESATPDVIPVKTLCKICVGETYNECKLCIDGYYMQDQYCLSCPQYCQSCTQANYCEKCQKGYYLHSNLCYSGCPSGTLPTQRSLYYLNGDISQDDQTPLFTTQQIQDAITSPKASVDVINAIDHLTLRFLYAVATDLNDVPLQTLPWGLNENNQPTYNNYLVGLECVNCMYFCSACYTGTLLYQNYDQNYRHDCTLTNTCPTGYEYKDEAKTECQVQLTSKPKTTFSSIGDDGTQSKTEDSVLTLGFTGQRRYLQEENFSCKWRIKDIINYDVQNQEEETERLRQKRIRNLSDQIDLSGKMFVIPSRLLIANKQYLIEVDVNYQGQNLQYSYTIPVIDKSGIQKMSRLNIKHDLIKVYPINGISGLTEFTAEYIFSNVPLFQLNGWSFKIKIEDQTMVFNELNHLQKFIIPGNEAKQIVIIFEAQREQDVYQTVRKITLTANPTYNYQELSVIQEIQNSPNEVGLNSIQQGASIINNDFQTQTQQVCPNLSVIKDKDSTCCGHGSCKYNQKQDQNYCDCKTGFQGRYCQKTQQMQSNYDQVAKPAIENIKKKIQNNQIPQSVEGVINSLQKLQNVVEGNDKKVLVGIYNDISKKIDNSRDCQKLIEALSTVKDNIASDQSISKEEKIQLEISATDSIIQAVKSQQKTQNPSQNSRKMVSGDIVAYSQYITPSAINSDVSTNLGGFDVIIDKELFKNNEFLTFINIKMPKEILQNQKGFENALSDIIEISIYNDQQEQIVLEEGNYIKYTVLSPIISEGKQPACLHYDEQAKELVSRKGCTYQLSVDQVSLQQQLTCTCNHTTLFQVGQIDVILTDDSNSNSGQNSTGESPQLIIERQFVDFPGMATSGYLFYISSLMVVIMAIIYIDI